MSEAACKRWAAPLILKKLFADMWGFVGRILIYAKSPATAGFFDKLRGLNISVLCFFKRSAQLFQRFLFQARYIGAGYAAQGGDFPLRFRRLSVQP